MSKYQSKIAKLRARAETLLHAAARTSHDGHNGHDGHNEHDGHHGHDGQEKTEVLVKELNLYQIELELQLEESQKSYAALEAAHRRYNRLFDNTSIGFLHMDKDKRITGANFAACRMLGVDRHRLRGSRLNEFVPDEFHELYDCCCQSLFDEQESQSCEIEIQHSSGSRLPVILNTDKEKDSEEFFVSITNLSPLKLDAEIFARNSELAKEVNQLRLNVLSSMSPEFRNLLASVLSTAELLYKHDNNLTPEKKGQLFDCLRNLISYLNDSVHDGRTIKELDKSQAFKTESFNVLAFTKQLLSDIELFTDGQKISLQFFDHEKNPTIAWNKNLYRRIVMNLISSLFKFSSEKISCKLELHESSFTLRIDTLATTFSEQELEQVFKAFSQSNNTGFVRGRGNGLVLAYHTVKSCGGTMRYSSNGEGIRFVIALPRIQIAPDTIGHEAKG